MSTPGIEVRVSRAAVLVWAACFLSAQVSAETTDALQRAREFKQTAIRHLRRAQLPGANKARDSKEAVAALKSAAELLEAYKEPRPREIEQELEDVNSLIYWVSKMTPVDVSDLRRPPRAKPRRGRSRDQLAREHFERARQHARENPGDHFLAAVRYFEVADRFQGTKWSLLAQKLSLEHHRKVLAGPSADESKPDRAAAVKELAEALGEKGLTRKDKLEMAEKFVAAFPGDALADEVDSIRSIFAARGPDERSRAVARYFRLYPNGRFAGALARPKEEDREARTFNELVTILRSNGPAREKARACRDFLAAFPRGSRRNEVAGLEEAFSAVAGEKRIAAWASYQISFPKGALAEEASKVLGRSEAVLFALMKRALSEGDEARTVELGELYLDVLPKGPAAAETGSLLAGVMRTSPGAERREAIQRHLRAFPGSALAGALRRMADRSQAAAEGTAFEILVREFAAAGSDAERQAACERFLAAHPRGARAKEVKALRAAFALGSAKARLAAARRHVAEYPEGPFAGQLEALEKGLAGAIEKEAYRAAKAAYSDESKSFAARLAACESYVTEFPDGEHVEAIRACEEGMRSLIQEEARAFKAFEKSLSRVPSPAEGSRLCDEFLEKYPGGSSRGKVVERRRGLEKRIAEAAEAEAFRALKAELADGSRGNTRKADACLRFIANHASGRRRGEVMRLLKSFARVPVAPHAARIKAAAFSADSKHLFTIDAEAGESGTGVHGWRLPEVRPAMTYRIRPTVTVSSAAFSLGNGGLLLGERTGGVTVVDVLGGRALGRYRLGPGPIVSVCPAPDDVVVTASVGDGKLRSWQKAWRSETAYACPGGVSAGAADRKGGMLAAGGPHGEVSVFRSGRPGPVWSVPGARRQGHRGRVDCVAFSPDGRYLVSTCAAALRRAQDGGTELVEGAAEGVVRLWRASSGDVCWQAEDGSRSAAFVDDNRVATGECIRSVGDGGVLAKLGGGGPVAASPDGRFIFTGDDTGDDEGGGTVWYIPALLAE